MVFWQRRQAWEGITAGVWRWAATGLPLVAMLILYACGGTDSAAPFTQTVGDLSATLEVVPNPPPVMQDTTLVLTLRDANGDPVSGASVMFDLTMPAMEMPENRPQPTEAEPGIYRADVTFTMAGEWQIDVEVVDGEAREVLTFMVNTK
jgi:hypothetical protein